MCVCVCVCVCVCFVSSPYLLVFGDDCVRGTREQTMLQVDLVRLSNGAEKNSWEQFLLSFITYGFGIKL